MGQYQNQGCQNDDSIYNTNAFTKVFNKCFNLMTLQGCMIVVDNILLYYMQRTFKNQP